MKEIKYNAKVIQDFNDKNKIDPKTGYFYKWEKNEIIKDMDRERFEELKAKGFVEEEKSFKDNKKKEWE